MKLINFERIGSFLKKASGFVHVEIGMAAENKLFTPCGVPGAPNESENSLATYLDVAVMRCLFISHWSEDGFFWALMFLQRR